MTDPIRERTLAIQNIADAEWARARRIGSLGPKCPDCEHRTFHHDRAEDESVRNCRDCGCDRYARVF